MKLFAVAAASGFSGLFKECQMISESLRHQLILVTVCCLTYLPNLGGTHLWDEDEAYFGRIACEMSERHDLIVPYFNGEVSVHKPPLMYWVMIAGFQMFGVCEFAARIGSTVFAIANVVLTYHLGRLLFSPRAGFWSALALATCLQFVLIARAAVADQELLFFCAIPILVLVAGTRLNRNKRPANALSGPICAADLSWFGWAVAYASMSIAVLDKGPVGAVLPTAVMGLFFQLAQAEGAVAVRCAKITDARWHVRCPRCFFIWITELCRPAVFLRTLWQMRPITAIGVFAIIGLPWYIAVGLATQGVWPREFLLVHNVNRFSRGFEGHHGGWFYYLVVICIGTYPWCIFIYHGLRLMGLRLQQGDQLRPANLLIGSWIAVWLSAFTLAGTKLPHYVMPAYPAIALLYGCFIEASLAGSFELGRGWMRAAWSNPVVVGIGMLIVFPIVTRTYLPGEEILTIAGLIPLAGGCVCLWAEGRGRRSIAYISLAAVAVSMSLAVLAWGAARADRHQTSHAVGRWLKELSTDSSASLNTFGCFDCSLVYYTDSIVRELPDSAAVISCLQQESGTTFVLTTSKKLAQIQPGLPQDVSVLRRMPRFLKRGDLILLGRRTPNARASAAVAISRSGSEQLRVE